MSNEKTPGTNVTPPHWIAPGISFTNPMLARTSTHVRNVPWMIPAGWKPLSVLSQGYPNTGSGNMSKNKNLKTRKPYWRRTFKEENLVRMGHNFKEVPSFEEVVLGESVSQNTSPAPVAQTNFWGAVSGMLTSVGSIWQQKAALKVEQKIAVEQAKIQAASAPQLTATPTMIAMGIGAVALGYMVLSKRR